MIQARIPAAFLLFSIKEAGERMGGNGTSSTSSKMLRASHRPAPAVAASPRPRHGSSGGGAGGNSPTAIPAVPVPPLEWPRRRYFPEETAAGAPGLAELRGCGPRGSGRGGAGRRGAPGKHVVPSQGAPQCRQLPGNQRIGRGRGPRAARPSLRRFGAARVVPLRCFRRAKPLRSRFCWEAASKCCP